MSSLGSLRRSRQSWKRLVPECSRLGYPFLLEEGRFSFSTKTMPFCFLPFRRTAGLTLAAVLCPFSVPADTELNIPGYRLIWNDEFEEAVVDASRWEVNVGVNAWYVRQSDNRTIEPHWFGEPYEPYTNAGTINNERQYYHPDNVTVDDGVLQIEARVESIQSPVGIYNPSFHRYTSGKLNTADEFQFQYGIVKWRAQLPAGQGMWPALWMLNAPNPWFWDQEIDVMEAKGSLPFESSSAHHFKVGPNKTNFTNSRELGGTDNLQQGFHEYGLEWTSTLIRTWRDEAEVFTDTQDVPQEPMFLIMNAAVGGNFDGEPQSDAIFPSRFLIDWVRVWQPTLTPSDLSNGGFERYQGPQWADWNTLDDGNLETVTDGALHGTSSVRIKRRNEGASAPSPADNLLTNGTAAGWNAWLNQLNANGEETGGGFTDLTAIPATATGNTVTTGLHQTAPSPRANAVVFRELSGSFARGKTLTYTGTVSINSAFPGDASAHAFIRIFNPDYSFNDVAVSVLAGGDFTLEATIPAANVPIVQVGVETIGPTGGSGSLTASSLFLLDTTGGAQPDTVSTGFQQTVTAEVGQTFRYGVLTANDSADPMTSSASGRLRLQFFDVNGAQLSEQVTPCEWGRQPCHRDADYWQCGGPHWHKDGAALHRTADE
jgi:beta-glucanase (GH16 family)